MLNKATGTVQEYVASYDHLVPLAPFECVPVDLLPYEQGTRHAKS